MALLSAGTSDRWPKGGCETGASEYKGAPARVVFADDDAVLRQLLSGLLGFLPHVTVVGEAADGIEAVQLVAQHYPDTVLLDIGMPRLDGFGAAEVIRSFRPRTRLMLHTAEPNDEKRRRAKALGLPLLDKLQLNATTDLVEQYAVSDEHPLASDIEPLVLLALAGRADAGVLVVKADESVPFYNPAFAAVVDLPFPPESVTLSDLRASGVLGLRADGSPYPLDEQPLARAFTGRTPVAEVVYLREEDGSLRPFTITSLPFFNPGGELIGVGSYVTDAHHPQPRITS